MESTSPTIVSELIVQVNSNSNSKNSSYSSSPGSFFNSLSQPLINIDRYNENNTKDVADNFNVVSSESIHSRNESENLSSTSSAVDSDDGVVGVDDGVVNRSIRNLLIRLQSSLDMVEEKLKSIDIKILQAERNINLIKKNSNYLNKQIEKDANDIYNRIFDIDCRLIQNEQYSRRESLIISVIPDSVSQRDLEG